MEQTEKRFPVMKQIEKPQQWQVHDWCGEMHRKSLIINAGALGARFFGFCLIYARAKITS